MSLINVNISPEGELVGAWKLDEKQIKNLLEYGGNVQ
jgi:hypothetical protein